MSDALKRADAVPAAVTVEVGGAVIGLGRQASYEATWRNELPTIKFGRRRFVPVARLEELVGRPITVADVERAERIVSERKRTKASHDAGKAA